MSVTIGDPLPCANCGHADPHWSMSRSAPWHCQHLGCVCAPYIAPPDPAPKLYTQADLDAARLEGETKGYKRGWEAAIDGWWMACVLRPDEWAKLRVACGAADGDIADLLIAVVKEAQERQRIADAKLCDAKGCEGVCGDVIANSPLAGMGEKS